jgi:hypothetical protein
MRDVASKRKAVYTTRPRSSSDTKASSSSLSWSLRHSATSTKRSASSTLASHRLLQDKPLIIEAERPLNRGAACLACRKRRTKCDGVLPVCGRCHKVQANPRRNPNEDFECVYEAAPKVMSPFIGSSHYLRPTTTQPSFNTLSYMSFAVRIPFSHP